MKILITGIGITGKSSFRRNLVRNLREIGLEVVQYDSDEFKELRSPEDIDCGNAPKSFQQDVFYIIEDIHGSEERAYLPLKEYNLIIYLLPSKTSHAVFWLSRMWKWFQFGQFSWEKDIGWKGTGKSFDYRNILPIIRTIIRDFKNRKAWIIKDINTISRFPHIIIRPYWTRKGIRFSFF